jgi:hypothetical protein
MAKPKDVSVQALKLNDLMWFTVPGDFSGESALMIRNLLALKGSRAVVTGYNGGYVGYIIPSKYFYYETMNQGQWGGSDQQWGIMFRISC